MSKHKGYSAAARIDPLDIELEGGSPTGPTQDIQDNTWSNRTKHRCRQSRTVQLILVVTACSVLIGVAALWISMRDANTNTSGGTSVTEDPECDLVELPGTFETLSTQFFGWHAKFVEQAAICGPMQKAALAQCVDELKTNERMWAVAVDPPLDTTLLHAYNAAVQSWVIAAMPCTCGVNEVLPTSCGQPGTMLLTLADRAKTAMNAWYSYVATTLHEDQLPPDLVDQWLCHERTISAAAAAKVDKNAWSVLQDLLANECIDAFENVGLDIDELSNSAP